MIKLNNKTKYHIHIYKVIGKIEIDLKARDGVGAKTKALLLAKRKKLKFKKSDCNFITIAFDEVKGKFV